jgi:hypothetical protein
VSVGRATALRLPVFLLGMSYLVAPAREAISARLDALLLSRPRWALGGTAAAFAAVLVTFKVRQHLALQTTAYDLSMFQYALQNTLDGRLLHAYGIDANFLGHHFSPVLLALVPPYALWPSPYMLLVAQGLALAATTFPLFAFCRASGVRPLTSWLVTVGFFTNLVVWRAFVFDFHVELLGPALFFAVAWALVAQRWGWAALFLAGTLTVKEDTGLLVALLAVYLLASQKPRRWLPLGVTALVSLLFAAAALKFLIPMWRPSGAGSDFLVRYGSLGSSLGEIALSVLTKPGLVASRVFAAPMRGVMNSMAWAPMLNPLSLAASMPLFLMHLLADYEPQLMLGVYYGLWGLLLLWAGVPRTLTWLGPEKGLLLALALVGFKPGFDFLPRVTEADIEARRLLATFDTSDRLSLPTVGVPHVVPGPVRQIFPEVNGTNTLVLLPCRMRWPLADDAYWPAVTQLAASGQWRLVRTLAEGVVLERAAEDGRLDSALMALQARCP